MSDRPDDLRTEYRQRFAGRAEYRQGVWRILCADFFARYIPRNAVVLDVGAGWGEFINNIPVARKYAMDLNPDTQERIAPDVTLLQQDCVREWPLETGSLDVVFTSNFLEHLPDLPSVEATISQAYRCLKEGGRIIVLGPNIRYARKAYWDFQDHKVALSDASVSGLLAMRGFEVQANIPRFLPYTMSKGAKVPLFLVRLYLRAPVLWTLFGKQFLVIGRKRSRGEGPTQ